MIEREIELEDFQEALDSVQVKDLFRVRMKYQSSAKELREALCTVFKHLHNKLNIPADDCCKLVIYNALVALMSTPEYEPSNP